MKIQIELNVGERYALMSILPVKERFDTLLLIKGLKERLAVTEEEKKEIEWVEHKNGSAVWEDEKDLRKPFTFIEGEVELLKKLFKAVEESGDLHISLMALYEGFVKEKGVEVLPN